MKNAVLKTKHVLMALSIIMFISCNAEDGAVGPQGPAGTNGTNGTNGTDGADGNANVIALTYDLSAVAASSHTEAVPEITQDVFDNDIVLGFVKRNGFVYPLPALEVQGTYDIRTLYNVGSYIMNFMLSSNGNNHVIAAGDLEELNIVIIAPSNKSFGSNKQTLFAELRAAGVDVNNYHELLDYYGISY